MFLWRSVNFNTKLRSSLISHLMICLPFSSWWMWRNPHEWELQYHGIVFIASDRMKRKSTAECGLETLCQPSIHILWFRGREFWKICTGYGWSPTLNLCSYCYTAEWSHGFEVLIAVTMKNTFFWVITPCSLEKARYQRNIWPPTSGSMSKPRKKLLMDTKHGDSEQNYNPKEGTLHEM
jgi:hypothetical protein